MYMFVVVILTINSYFPKQH